MNPVVSFIANSLILVLLAIIARPAIAVTAQSIAVDSEKGPDFDQQIQLIDAEIWLLKAELAQKNGDVVRVKHYLEKIDVLFSSNRLPNQFISRIEQLKHYLTLIDQASPSGPKNIPYRFAPHRMLALLPMTGLFAQAGQEIYQAMVTEFQLIAPQYSIEVLDTNIYDSMQAVWEWVELYQPSFIFGPLQKDNVHQLASLKIDIPVLAFNEAAFSKPYVKFLTPHSSLSLVQKMVSLMGNGVYRRVMVLTDDSTRSKTMYQQLLQTWAAEQSLEDEVVAQIFHQQSVSSHVDKAMEKVVQGDQSEIRRNWLQKILQTSVHYVPRTRGDIDMIISFLPYDSAMQVTPLLAYYQLNHVPHYWVPSKLPATGELIRSLPFWQGTSAIFPSYYTKFLNTKNDDKDYLNNQVGIFPALGSSAIKAVTRLSLEQPNAIQTELGILSLDAMGRLHLSPDLVWIDKGGFEKLDY
ncbi:hypothetical protein CYQ88_03170 [Hydrogenovibrio sp. SC-1]|uniref:penicillin-binding protein activator n=1 Tax=Hydrogenovibrio sp. SC-1 TaxID=2065820 RepID=UPI000C7B5CC2|nr:penicillin-binding protein activator [Hydrogenovibrio sp. SC-1]PLA74918.1 hypothetical protein CYQ88_03170 [Hydrogenovibrio sp. SC-1]